MGYIVIKDTREKSGYNFMPYKECVGMEVSTLKTGDYSIKELPDLVCIERKACVEEMAMNLGADLPRFEKELIRMQEYKYRYLVLEFSMSDLIKYPEGTAIPKYKLDRIKLTGKYLIRVLLQLQLKYDFQIIFADNLHNGFLVASSILKRIWENHGS